MTSHRAYVALWSDTEMPMAFAVCPTCGEIAGPLRETRQHVLRRLADEHWADQRGSDGPRD